MGKAMALPGMCVALSSILFYDKKLVVLSLLGTYLNGLVLDHFIFGLNLKKRVCIISEKEAFPEPRSTAAIQCEKASTQ